SLYTIEYSHKGSAPAKSRFVARQSRMRTRRSRKGLKKVAPAFMTLARERWPSGLRRTLGKRVYGKPYRGFESHSLRQRFHVRDSINKRISIALNFGPTLSLTTLTGCSFRDRSLIAISRCNSSRA